MLLTIAKSWKKPKCPSIDELKNCGTFTQWNTMQQEKGGIPTFCNSKDVTEDYNAK